MAIPLINFGGLASGLDTTSIIDQLVQVERIPVQQLEAKKAGYEAKDAAWTVITTRLSALQTAIDAIKEQGSFAKFATVASSSESVAATITSGATPTTATFTVGQLATAHQLAADTIFTSGDDLVEVGTFTLTIDGTDNDFTTDGTGTVAELASEINAADLGVSASLLKVDTDQYRLVLTASSTGEASEFTAAGTQASLSTTTVLSQAQDAEITLGEGAGAITVSRDSNTVTDLVEGVSLQLNEVTGSAVTVTVTRDVDAAAAAVQTLVDELNAVANQLNSYTSYDATSKSAGPLQGDTTARSLATDLRSVVSSLQEDLTGNFTFASSIGISLTREGTFTLDTDALRTAMDENFADVAEFFEGDGTAVGMANAIDEYLDLATGTDGAVERARDRWQAQIEGIDDAIVRLEDRIDRREAALIARFARLETSMSQLSGMAAQLAAAIPGLSG